MAQHLYFRFHQLHCRDETGNGGIEEIGSDEIHLLGFGLGPSGLVMIPDRKVGSFNDKTKKNFERRPWLLKYPLGEPADWNGSANFAAGIILWEDDGNSGSAGPARKYRRDVLATMNEMIVDKINPADLGADNEAQVREIVRVATDAGLAKAAAAIASTGVGVAVLGAVAILEQAGVDVRGIIKDSAVSIFGGLTFKDDFFVPNMALVELSGPNHTFPIRGGAGRQAESQRLGMNWNDHNSSYGLTYSWLVADEADEPMEHGPRAVPSGGAGGGGGAADDPFGPQPLIN